MLISDFGAKFIDHYALAMQSPLCVLVPLLAQQDEKLVDRRVPQRAGV
jgi:hypothetical protein